MIGQPFGKTMIIISNNQTSSHFCLLPLLMLLLLQMMFGLFFFHCCGCDFGIGIGSSRLIVIGIIIIIDGRLLLMLHLQFQSFCGRRRPRRRPRRRILLLQERQRQISSIIAVKQYQRVAVQRLKRCKPCSQCKAQNCHSDIMKYAVVNVLFILSGMSMFLESHCHTYIDLFPMTGRNMRDESLFLLYYGT